MRIHSVYLLDCPAFHAAIESETRRAVCPECEQEIEVEWPAPYRDAAGEAQG
jgi:hypothetical protein